jgi:hypothetical protein
MQKKFYPRKKKAHTLKCQAVVYRFPGDKRPLIAALPPSRYGKTDAKKIYAQARVITPKGINRGGDTGYPGTLMKTLHKKPKGGTLTDPQKTGNRVNARDRISVEHGTGGMQRFGIAAQRWRTPRRTRPIIMKNAAGLANWLALTSIAQ